MSLTQVTGPYPIFTDLDGSPLDDGYLYIGDQNDDPETNPIQVFWDSALTIPATQPIRTNSGYAWRNGTPGLLYTAGPFSITIRNKRNEFVLYSPVGYGFDPAAVSASVVKNDFTGDGVEVDFTLSAAPSTILATNVFINGVYQEKDSYSLLGNVLTFSIAPPLNSSIEVMTNETGVINSGNATAISYTASFPGAVAQTVQTKLEQFISVEDFGAVGDGVTDDTAAIQDALDAANGGTLYFEAKTYKTTASLIIPGHTTKIEGRGAIIDYYGSAHAIGYALVGGTTYPVETGIRQLGINVNSGTGASGIQLRASYSQFEEVVITLRVGAVSARGFVLVGDETNGTGPYYNMFLRCGVQSGSGGADHIGVSFVASAPIYRSPNANTWIGGRIGQCATGIIIKGAGNTFINPTIENAALTGTAIKFEADTSVNCTQNQVFGSYIENANIAVQFTANANFNSVYSQFLTGVGTDVSDLGTSNLIIDTNSPAKLPLGVEFGALSSGANVLDYYEEGTWVPTLVGGTTAGSYSIATSTAKFTRIGNQITLSAQMAITVNSAGTGDLRFGGLPFPKGANSVLVGNVSIRNIAINASIVSLNAVQWTTSADSTFAIGGVRNNTSLLFLTCADVSAGAAVDVSITYYV
jgi:hypothetical protein